MLSDIHLLSMISFLGTFRYIKEYKLHKWIFRITLVIFFIFITWKLVDYKNKPVCDKCNVILISIDTLSALHLPCYGYERNTAPNLCAFANENILFENSYSQSNTTLDSHFSIFTSLYPHTHKVTEILGSPLSENYLTLTQMFRNNNYNTIYHGVLNDDHLPLNRGIERGFSTIQGETIDTWNNAYSKLIENNKKKKPTFLFLHTYAVHEPYLVGYGKRIFSGYSYDPNVALTLNEYQKITPEFINFAKKLITDKKMLKNKSEIEIGERLKKSTNYEEQQKVFNLLPRRVKYISFNTWNLEKLDKNNKLQGEYMNSLYDETIYKMDLELKKLFDLLKEQNFKDNTIVIITADHGQEHLEHGQYFHAHNLYRTSTQVPLIMRIPGVKSMKIKELVQGIDIYPTILSLTGITPISLIEGLDLSGLIKGSKNIVGNKYLLSEYKEFKKVVGVMDENYRFYFDFFTYKPIGLYNLNEDPGEQSSVLLQNPQKEQEFMNYLKTLTVNK